MKEITMDMMDELCALFVRVFNEKPWNDSWSQEQAKERLTDMINMPKFYGMAEYHEDKIIALIMGSGEMYFDGIHFQILEFCIDNEMQGHGIGKRVLKDFIHLLKEKGIEKCFLITSHGERTEKFYQKNGFVTDGNLCLMHN